MANYDGMNWFFIERDVGVTMAFESFHYRSEHLFFGLSERKNE
jgi:hypothetical protein